MNELNMLQDRDNIGTAHFQKEEESELNDEFRDSLYISESIDEEANYRQTFGIEESKFHYSYSDSKSNIEEQKFTGGILTNPTGNSFSALVQESDEKRNSKVFDFQEEKRS